MVKTETTEDWNLYERGKDYNASIAYLPIVNRNWRAYNLQLYDSMNTKGLPKVKIPMAQRIVRHSVASCMVKSVKMNYVVENIADGTEDPTEIAQKTASEFLSENSAEKWERLKMDSAIRTLLLNGANEGDYAAHTYWVADYDTGQTNGIELVFDENGDPVLDEATGEQLTRPVPILGEFFTEIVDGANVFFGNPNDKRVNFNGKPYQPYIIISGRETVKTLRAEAKKNKKENGLTDEQIKQYIVPDSDYNEQVGDRGKKELENGESEYGKATYIIKYWVDENDKIRFNKSVKGCYIRYNVDHGGTLYPVAWGNWDTVKNSYHGQALMTGLVENQMEIDKAYAKVLKYMGDMAFPKAIYNISYLPNGPSNKIGEAIGYEGDAAKPTDVLSYSQPGQLANGIIEFIGVFQSKTMEMLGASDTVLGNVNPENTSAIVALTQNSVVPLENVKANRDQFIEDLGYIWLDFITHKYKVPRKIAIDVDGQRTLEEFDPSTLADAKLRIKVDVIPAGYMDEFSATRTIENLFDRQVADAVDLVERIPESALPEKEKLLAKVKKKQKQLEEMQSEQFKAQAVAEFLQQKQAEIAQTPPPQ